MNSADIKVLETLVQRCESFPDGPNLKFRLLELLEVQRLELEARAIAGRRLIKFHTLECSSNSGEEPIKVEKTGVPVGKYFAVHQPTGKGPWTVTHLPSGLSACTLVPKRSLALAKAVALESIPGIKWAEENPLHRLDAVALDECTRISRAVDLLEVKEARGVKL